MDYGPFLHNAHKKVASHMTLSDLAYSLATLMLADVVVTFFTTTAGSPVKTRLIMTLLFLEGVSHFVFFTQKRPVLPRVPRST